MEINQFNLRVILASAVTAVAVAAILGGSAALHRSASSGGAPAGSASASASPSPDDGPSVAAWDGVSAPPIVLQLDGQEVVLEPWSACFGNGCFDGMPMPPFEDVGVRDGVRFSFPLEGWSFEATFSPSTDGQCDRQFAVPVEQAGEHTFLILAAGPPGSYDVDVFGRGPGGDVITTFAWTTVETGVLPRPTGYVGLVSDDDDGYIAYPLELGLNALASTPERASVTVTVTAADGSERTIGPVPAERGCRGSGSVFFRQDGSGGGEPFRLGPAPFDYRAEVSLDGETYVGTAVWPRDERADEAPFTDLEFAPPLPAFEG